LRSQRPSSGTLSSNTREPHVVWETDDGVWAIYFNTVLLATLDERDFAIRG
jgi:hypothetical protein